MKNLLKSLFIIICFPIVSCSFFDNSLKTEYYENGTIKAVGYNKKGKKDKK